MWCQQGIYISVKERQYEWLWPSVHPYKPRLLMAAALPIAFVRCHPLEHISWFQRWKIAKEKKTCLDIDRKLQWSVFLSLFPSCSVCYLNTRTRKAFVPSTDPSDRHKVSAWGTSAVLTLSWQCGFGWAGSWWLMLICTHIWNVLWLCLPRAYCE